jgi:hypothetical protein
MLRPTAAPLTMLLLALAACLGMLGGLARAADPGMGSYMYGTTTISGRRWIVQFNPVTQEETLIFNTELTSSVNAMAFDVVRNQLFFAGGNNNADLEGTYSLWVLDLNTLAMSIVAPYSQLGYLTGLLDNAAFYDGGYWYIPGKNPEARKASLIYTNGIPTGIANVAVYPFDDSSVEPDLSDIAINVGECVCAFAWVGGCMSERAGKAFAWGTG